MRVWKLANNYGYTLMELILATAVIGLISAVAIPNYTRYIEETKEKICVINQQTILYEYELYCMDEHEIPLSDYLNIYYAESDNNLCPCEGSYTAIGSGQTAKLTCCVHHNTRTEAISE